MIIIPALFILLNLMEFQSVSAQQPTSTQPGSSFNSKVTVNYRLGVFGFLAHYSLSGESVNSSSDNYGLDDYIVSDIYQGYAANFVKTLDPNRIGLPLWQALNRGDSRQVLHIGVDTKLKEVLHEERYRALNHLHHPDQ